jgi:DNA-binding NarL/FixJ family response regulator
MQVLPAVAIVDNHQLFRRTMRIILTRLGYEIVLEGANGEELIEKVRGGTVPAICLVDVNMPVLNGFETTQYMKQHWPVVKMILISLNTSEGYQQSALQFGADGFWTKNSSIELLQEILENCQR